MPPKRTSSAKRVAPPSRGTSPSDELPVVVAATTTPSSTVATSAPAQLPAMTTKAEQRRQQRAVANTRSNSDSHMDTSHNDHNSLRFSEIHRHAVRPQASNPPTSAAAVTSSPPTSTHLRPDALSSPQKMGIPFKKKKLYTFDELPLHLRDCQFILTHYRAYYTGPECVKSVLEIHNETGNIWTHLIGFVIFLALSIWVLTDVIRPGASFAHYLIFTVLSLGCMGCMACSTTFHTMLAHEDIAKFKKFHAMDYLGITLLIIASFVPCCFYVFVCQPALQWGYLVMICVIGSSGIITPLLPCFEEEFFFWPRLGIYVSIVCSGLIPTIHTCFATPLNHTTLPIYVGVLLMFLLYGTGVIVYATRFPERFAPGRFDLFLQSHQIWHIFVLAAAIVHFFNCVALYQNWSVMQGKC